MLTSEFARLLKKVDPNLQVNFANTTYAVNPDQGTCAVYMLGKWLEISEYDKSQLDEEGKALATREKEYLAYVPAKFIPEYSRYNPQLVVITPGYRDVLNKLKKMKPHLGGRINKVFGLSDWQNDWDRQAPWARALRQGVDVQKPKSVQSLNNTGYIMDQNGVHEVPKEEF